MGLGGHLGKVTKDRIKNKFIFDIWESSKNFTKHMIIMRPTLTDASCDESHAMMAKTIIVIGELNGFPRLELRKQDL